VSMLCWTAGSRDRCNPSRGAPSSPHRRLSHTLDRHRPRVSLFPSTWLIPNLVANSTFSLTPPFKACMHACAQSIKLAKTKNKQTRKETSGRRRRRRRKLKDLSEKDFVGEGAVDVGGVEEGDPGVDGVVDESNHVLFGLGRAIDGGHAHAAQALCGHL
jgi:hypothetical protein